MGENWWLWLLIAFIVIVLIIWLLSRKTEQPRDMARPILDNKPADDLKRTGEEIKDAAHDAARDVKREVIEPAGDAIEDAARDVKREVIEPAGDAIEDAARDVKREVIEPAGDAIEDAARDVKREVVEPVRDDLSGEPTLRERIEDTAQNVGEEIREHVIEPVSDTVRNLGSAAGDVLQPPAEDAMAELYARQAADLVEPSDPAYLPFFTAVKNNDLTLVEGIGPRIAELFKSSGIHDLATLANAQPLHLKALLDEANLGNLGNPETWPRQAALAVSGKWAELKAYQDSLRGGLV